MTEFVQYMWNYLLFVTLIKKINSCVNDIFTQLTTHDAL